MELNTAVINKFTGKTSQAAQLTHDRFLTLHHSYEISQSGQKKQKSDFQSQFSMSKNIRIIINKKSSKNMILGAHF